MNEFKKLVDVADQLLGPAGCPWDREQTFFTLQPYLLEETHELIEAIDENDPSKISEELGDVLYALIFIAKLAEKEKYFTLPEAIQKVTEKLIRRHPHVFGETQISSTDEVIKNWEEVKKKEGKKNPIENIPPTLPALARAQKVIHKLRRAKSEVIQEQMGDELGQRFWDLVAEAEGKGLDAESVLRRTCLAYEEEYTRRG